jgi:hypothetical protein
MCRVGQTIGELPRKDKPFSRKEDVFYRSEEGFFTAEAPRRGGRNENGITG